MAGKAAPERRVGSAGLTPVMMDRDGRKLGATDPRSAEASAVVGY
jgi:hypothetical protein